MTNNLCLPERNKLDSYLATAECLPPTPGLMIKLIALFRQPDRDVDEIVELMRQDPSVTTELLRRCNRSFFANEEPVTDITESVFRLGFYEVYRITVALFGQQAMSTAKINGSFEVEELWRHSVLAAIAGGAVARDVGESEGSAFTAGLLHDIGKIVLASVEGARYVELLRQHGHFGNSLDESEKEAFGFGHAEIGARLLRKWGVPDEVIVPVLSHHNQSWPEPFGRLAAIVNLANLMAHCIEKTPQTNPVNCPRRSMQWNCLI